MRAGGLLTVLVLSAALTACSAPRAVDSARQPRPAFRVLVFSKTTGYRHESIPAGIAAIERLGRRRRFAVDHTEDSRRFTNRSLARYDAVIFLSATGDPLDRNAQKRAFRRYIQRDGGFLGIHAASDGPRTWRWYKGLIGARFIGHAPGTPAAVVRVEQPRTAATRGLPGAWRRVDEWYSFLSSPRSRVRVLATVDERTYDPRDTAMGRDHPIAWCHRYDGGRSVYTAMGHTGGSFAEPRFVAHLLGSIRMAAGEAPFDCAP